jgi:hypothetical protein
MGFRDWIKRWRDGRPRNEGEIRGDSVIEDDGEIDPFNPFPEPVRLEILDVFDLHTIAPRDVKRVIVEYLMEAHTAGYSSVRIIHGKGRGVQREMVRSILKRTPFVENWTDAPPAAGGRGATIIRFSPEANKGGGV